MEREEQKVYFPNLDGLRFIGSLSIILFHIEIFKSLQGVSVLPYLYYFHTLGDQSVSLFFVLSGFLITYLLLKEKEYTGTINLKGFYTRRILKIWPLYYIILILGFFVLPHLNNVLESDYNSYVGSNWWATLIGCLLFLPATIFTSTDLPYTMRAGWSVRVEEFFYFLWPLLLKKSNNYLKACLITVAAMVMLRFSVFSILHIYKASSYYNTLSAIGSVIIEYRVSCMAIGGIGAYIIIKKISKITTVVYRKDVQLAIYIVTLILLFAKVHVPFIHFEFYSLLFCVIIMNLANNPQSIITLNTRWLNCLGKRSYGLYLYNPIVAILCIHVVKLYGNKLSALQMNLVLYVSVIAITIIAAIISYRFLEKPFLKLKQKYSIVKTRE